MSTSEASELAEILDRVKDWSPPSRIALARRILETLDPSAVVEPVRRSPVDQAPRGVPVENVLGLLRTDREPPGDEECRQIVAEERWKKYGH